MGGGGQAMIIERAAEILDPEHSEHYESIDIVREACRMGMEALKAQATKARLSGELHKIALHYGLKAQSDLLIEEIAELTKALSKAFRISDTSCQQPSNPISEEEAVANVAEEIADVEIMLEQVRYMFGISYDNIEGIKEKKVKRTLDLMCKENLVIREYK